MEEVALIVALKRYRSAVRPCAVEIILSKEVWVPEDWMEHPMDGQKDPCRSVQNMVTVGLVLGLRIYSSRRNEKVKCISTMIKENTHPQGGGHYKCAILVRKRRIGDDVVEWPNRISEAHTTWNGVYHSLN